MISRSSMSLSSFTEDVEDEEKRESTKVDKTNETDDFVFPRKNLWKWSYPEDASKLEFFEIRRNKGEGGGFREKRASTKGNASGSGSKKIDKFSKQPAKPKKQMTISADLLYMSQHSGGGGTEKGGKRQSIAGMTPRLKRGNTQSLPSSSAVNEIEDEEDDVEEEIETLLDKKLAEEEITSQYFGSEARSGFFQIYKEITKAKRLGAKDNNPSRPPSVRHEFLNKCISMQIPPKPIAIISNQAKASEICLRDYGIGESLAIALAESIRVDSIALSHVTSLDLTNNMIRQNGIAALAKSFTNMPTLKNIHLGFNFVGDKGTFELCSTLNHRACKISYLSLKGCKLGNIHTRNLCSALLNNSSIKYLDLSRNEISDMGARYIAPLLIEDNINVLSLAWNNIRSNGALVLAQALTNNINLLSLDVAWNGFATPIATTAMTNALKKNSSLAHLNLSNNGIDKDCLVFYIEALKVNKTLRHVHFEGNEASINFALELGCYTPIDKTSFYIPPSLDFMFQREESLENLSCWRETKNCLYCLGWRPHQFVYIPGLHGPWGRKIQVCVDANDWKPIELQKTMNNSAINTNLYCDGSDCLLESGISIYHPAEITLMVPPKSFSYSFIVDGLETYSKQLPTQSSTRNPIENAVNILAQELEKETFSGDLSKLISYSKSDLLYKRKIFEEEATKVTHNLLQLGHMSIFDDGRRVFRPPNQIENEQERKTAKYCSILENGANHAPCSVINCYDNSSINAEYLASNEKEINKIVHSMNHRANSTMSFEKWSKEKSFFGKNDHFSLKELKGPFENDMESLNVISLFGTDYSSDEHNFKLKEIGNIIWEMYPLLYRMFKHYGSISIINKKNKLVYNYTDDCHRIFIMNQEGFLKLMNSMNFYDDDLTLSCCQDIFEKIMEDNKSISRGYDFGLQRSKFIEALLLVSNLKWKSKTLVDAFKELSLNYIMLKCEKIDDEKFRYENLYREDVSSIISSQVDDIEEVFNMWLKSGQQFGISIDDFRNILEEGRIMKVEDENSSLHGKDISSQDMERCFIMSISVKVDDLDWQNSCRINIFEFVEALCRVISKLVLPNNIPSTNKKLTAKAFYLRKSKEHSISELAEKMNYYLHFIIKKCLQGDDTQNLKKLRNKIKGIVVARNIIPSNPNPSISPNTKHRSLTFPLEEEENPKKQHIPSIGTPKAKTTTNAATLKKQKTENLGANKKIY